MTRRFAIIWRARENGGECSAAARKPLPLRWRARPKRPPIRRIRMSRRASIAVMPFVDRDAIPGAAGGPAAGLAAGALAYDVITRLAKLRALFVIAQGTVFALHERGIGPEDAGRTLNVDYVVSGSLQQRDKRLTVSVELVETRTARIVWAEVFNQTLDDAFRGAGHDRQRIVASIASEIETIERNRAILRPPNSLDAWEAHHRGLWHMYRFSQSRQRAGPAFLRDRHSARSDLRARPCRPVLHAFSECLSELERSAGPKSSAPTKPPGRPDGRRSRSRRSLGDGPGALAARRARPVHCRTRRNRSISVRILRSRITTWRLSIRHRGRRGPRPSRRPIIRAISVRSIRCCSACSARARWR